VALLDSVAFDGFGITGTHQTSTVMLQAEVALEEDDEEILDVAVVVA
jgi:ribosomal protein L11 methylase PrmA